MQKKNGIFFTEANFEFSHVQKPRRQSYLQKIGINRFWAEVFYFLSIFRLFEYLVNITKFSFPEVAIGDNKSLAPPL